MRFKALVVTVPLSSKSANDFTYTRPNNDFIWRVNDSLMVSGTANITTNNFSTDGTITANTFALSLAGDFDYRSDFVNAGTITANNLNFTARNGIFTNDTTIDLATGSLGITANSFTNTGEVVADTFNLSVAGDFDYAADFINNGNITANNLNFTARNGIFTNDTTIDLAAGSLGITANSFTNTGGVVIADTFALSVADSFVNTGGVVNADTFNLSVAGDFDYAADFEDNGTVTTNALNLTVGGNFTYDDVNNGILLGLRMIVLQF